VGERLDASCTSQVVGIADKWVVLSTCFLRRVVRVTCHRRGIVLVRCELFQGATWFCSVGQAAGVGFCVEMLRSGPAGHIATRCAGVIASVFDAVCHESLTKWRSKKFALFVGMLLSKMVKLLCGHSQINVMRRPCRSAAGSSATATCDRDWVLRYSTFIECVLLPVHVLSLRRGVLGLSACFYP
jgi:hypothetical protein